MQNAVDVFAAASSAAGFDHSKSFVERATAAGEEITNGSRVLEAAIVLEGLGEPLKPPVGCLIPSGDARRPGRFEQLQWHLGDQSGP